MLDIFDMFLVGGVFCGFITSMLLFIQARRYQLYANRLLSLVIFPMCWYVFIYLLIKSGAISHVPDLFKAGSPLYYVIGPCSYLYARSVIMDENRPRKWDWLHFLPAVLHFLELMPFYLADAEVKRQIIRDIGGRFNESYDKGSGLIPAAWHIMFRPVHMSIYLALQWKLLASALNKNSNYTLRGHVFGAIRVWLFSLTGLMTILIAGLFIQTILGVMIGRPSASAITTGRQMQIVMTFAFFAMSAYLFFKPDILYGTLKTGVVARTRPRAAVPVADLPEQQVAASPAEENEPAESAVARRETLLNDDLINFYSEKIEQHLLLKESFRKQGLSINQLADELAIPAHHLSYVLNYHYKQRFNDFINRYRVNYVQELFRKEEYGKMKLEILATEAGFLSRSTFFAAFKKITGMTPADYARQSNSV